MLIGHASYIVRVSTPTRVATCSRFLCVRMRPRLRRSGCLTQKCSRVRVPYILISFPTDRAHRNPDISPCRPRDVFDDALLDPA
jgi:hypothetical protein